MSIQRGDRVAHARGILGTRLGVVEGRYGDEHVVVAMDDGYEGQLEIFHQVELSVTTPTNFDDVGLFHGKFDLPVADGDMPVQLDVETFAYRNEFLAEELKEFGLAYDAGDLPDQADALVDLVYVALGTAHMMNLPWQELWDEVQRKNMQKVRSTGADDARGKRKNNLDVVKPEGWTAPAIGEILRSHGWEG